MAEGGPNNTLCRLVLYVNYAIYFLSLYNNNNIAFLNFYFNNFCAISNDSTFLLAFTYCVINVWRYFAL